MDSIKTQVINILIKELIIDKNYTQADLSLDLLQNNMIDSLNIITLIPLFEETFNITFDSDDILGKNWMTINAIVNTITQKLNPKENKNGR